METPKKRLLIVGLGLTGALTASIVKKERRHTEVVVWEKTQHIGGRMLVKRNPFDPLSVANLGAQFLEASPENIRTHAQFYEELMEAGLLAPLLQRVEGMSYPMEGIHHFVAPEGMASIVAFYVRKEVVTAYMKHEVSSLDLDDTQQLWRVRAANGSEDIFDIILFTIPVPQLFHIKGFLKDYLWNESPEPMAEALRSVKFSPQISLAMFFQTPLKHISWPGSFFSDPVVQFVSRDNMLTDKKQRADITTVLVAQSTEHFAHEMGHRPLEELEKTMVHRLGRLVPHCPPQPDHLVCQPWLHARVKTPYNTPLGYVILHENPLLILGGDSFTSSNFDGCIDSAINLVELILQAL